MKFLTGAVVALLGLVLIWQIAGMTGKLPSGTNHPAKDMRTMR